MAIKKSSSSGSVASRSASGQWSRTWMITILALAFGSLAISFTMQKNTELTQRVGELEQQVFQLQSVQ